MKITGWLLLLVSVALFSSAILDVRYEALHAAEWINEDFAVSHASARVDNDRLAIRNLQLKQKIDLAEHRKNDGGEIAHAQAQLVADQQVYEDTVAVKDEQPARKSNSETMRAIGGAVCLMSGLLLMYVGRKHPQSEPSIA